MSALDRAARYLAGVDDDGSAAEFEAALFGDRELLRAAAWLLELRLALKDLASEGPVVPVVTETELAAVAAERRVQEVAGTAISIVQSLARDIDFIALRLAAPLEDARAIDVEFRTPTGIRYFCVHEAPFDPRKNEVLVLCERHVALAAGEIQIVIRDERGVERASYVLPALRPAE